MCRGIGWWLAGPAGRVVIWVVVLVAVIVLVGYGTPATEALGYVAGSGIVAAELWARLMAPRQLGNAHPLAE